jgi:ceramide glucosyltransferase
VLWEPAIGWLVAGGAAVVGLAAAGGGMAWITLGLFAHTAAWLAAEKWFMAGRGLEFGARAAGAALVREALAPVLMVSALAGRTIDWRGTDLGGQWRERGDDLPKGPA